MSTLRLEFFKCRRRKIYLVCLALIAAQLLWMSVSFRRMEPEDLRQGWMMILYNLAMIDSFMLPLATAVIASRNCEIEHKGSTLKCLETLTTPGKIYNTKLLWGAIVLALVLILRTLLFLGIGYYEAFQGGIPYRAFAVFTFISWLVSMMLYTLQQGLSLRFANQAVPLVIGLAGSFLGLMGLFFPDVVQRLLPWSYYGLFSQVAMWWDEATRYTEYYWRTPELIDVVIFACWFLVFFIVGRTLFVRKEV
ncbi:MAG: ABC transporter permease [Peptococcaceae bacterium]|nr:ABC transporter permease [Peptococcaceae bacterium]